MAMLSPTTRVHIERVPIGRILMEESRARYPGMVLLYVQQMWEHPHDDAGFIRLRPSAVYHGLFVLEDGFHRLLAAVIVGKADMLAVVVEDAV